ncbi:MAG TPA: phosphoribosylanthranilate isomerase [Opitutaceae bacterium]|nr:phosphoribosylanthranilate isomerase [Opitutaceae bacterium]
MINGIRLKICGLTTLVDADLADGCGADYLGFILYPQSPRYIPLETFKAMAKRLPPRKKVAVCVMPSPSELVNYASAGFDLFQIHFPLETPDHVIASWAENVGVNRLWLAPKLPPEVELPESILSFSQAVLWDSFKKGSFGGTGETSDWAKFKRTKEAHPEKTWILAGGLNPENIGAAVQTTDTRFVDVNSGVESTPGVKSEEKLKRLVVALHEATKHENPNYS